MTTGKKLSDFEKAERAERKIQKEKEKRVSRRIVMNDSGSVSRKDIAGLRARRNAVKIAPVDEEQAKVKAERQQAEHEAKRNEREKESRQYMREYRKKRQVRREMDIQNTGIEIAKAAVTDPLTRHSRNVWVNKVDGYLMEQHHRQPKIWTLPMVDGGNKFAREWALGHSRGLGCAGFEPRVDNSSGAGDNSLSIGALLRLRDLKRDIGDESYKILELVCGYCFTLAELQAKGLGHSRMLGERLRQALVEAAAFYRYIPEVPPSRFIREANQLIDRLKNQA